MASLVSQQRLEFAPPRPQGMARSVVAALAVHGLLLVALTAGIQWQQDEPLAADAELWSAVPMAAAPKLQEVEPPPPEPAPQPAPKPVLKPPVAPDRDADIALAKKRKLDDEKKAKAKLEEERKKKERLDKERLEKEKLDKERAEKERKDKEAKKQQAQKDSKAAAEEAKKLDAIRQDNLKRMAGLAGASGGPGATGAAKQASGPSESYGGRIRARVKPNITFDTNLLSGNPSAEVEVVCGPDGTVLSRKLVKPSGNAAWDNAVLKAIDKTEVFPRDSDGRVHSPLLLVFRPND